MTRVHDIRAMWTRRNIVKHVFPLHVICSGCYIVFYVMKSLFGLRISSLDINVSSVVRCYQGSSKCPNPVKCLHAYHTLLRCMLESNFFFSTACKMLLARVLCVVCVAILLEISLFRCGQAWFLVSIVFRDCLQHGHFYMITFDKL